MTLLRLAAVTHGFDQNQRFMELAITDSTSSAGLLAVEIPDNPAVAPPGHYMMFVLGDGGNERWHPSEAMYFQIGDGTQRAFVNAASDYLYHQSDNSYAVVETGFGAGPELYVTFEFENEFDPADALREARLTLESHVDADASSDFEFTLKVYDYSASQYVPIATTSTYSASEDVDSAMEVVVEEDAEDFVSYSQQSGEWEMKVAVLWAPTGTPSGAWKAYVDELVMKLDIDEG